MARKLGDIVASLENLSEEGQLGATEAAMNAAETAVDVADGNTEINKDVAEIDNIEVAIEDALEAEDKIGNILDAAEDTMKEGGMSDKEAKLVEISVESIMNNLGMGHRSDKTGMYRTPVASLESFKGAGKGAATLYTIESLKEKAKTVGTTIVAALKAAFQTVVSFLVRLTKNRALLEKHLTNLQKFVASIKTDEKKKDRIAGGAAAISIDGGASPATAKEILTNADKLITASIRISEAIGEKVGTGHAGSTITSAVEGVGPLTHGRKLETKKDGDYVTVSFTEAGKGAETAVAPTKADMNALLTQALAVVRRLREYEKTQSKLKSAMDKIIDALKEGYDRVRSKVGGDDKSKDGHELLAAVRANARQARTMMTKAGSSFPSAVFGAVKAVADYVAAGARNLGAAAAEAPGAAPASPAAAS